MNTKNIKNTTNTPRSVTNAFPTYSSAYTPVPFNKILGLTPLNAGSIATLTGGCTNVVATSWYTILEQAPNATVVPDAAVRRNIVASGFPWRVRDKSSGIEMLLVPAGTFTIGEEGWNTPHTVTLTSAFYLGKTVVTQAQWHNKMGSHPSYFSGNANNPVEQVSWNDITGFHIATGLRLPTEAEWEYACRGGTTTAFHSMPGYPNGTNDDSPLGNIAWNADNSGGTTHAVGGKSANAFGLYDMSGNVWEWCQDWYGDYSESKVTTPTEPSVGQYGAYRVLRGGCWNVNSSYCRSSSRDCTDPDDRSNSFGFRVARTP
jgi:formylglycine-generating enzyme required for sulfatase activity